MKVKRSKLVALFQALDFKTADKWNKARLVGRIQGLKEVVDDDTDVGEHQELLDELLDAVEKDSDITIEDDMKTAEETEGEAKATKAVPKKKPAANKAPKERDFLGNGTETQCSKINHALSTTPQHPDAIAAACGVSLALVKSHTKTLHGKSLILKNDEGFYLDDETAAKHPSLPKKGASKKKAPAKVETDSDDSVEAAPAKASKAVPKKPAKAAKPAKAKAAEEDEDGEGE